MSIYSVPTLHTYIQYILIQSEIFLLFYFMPRDLRYSLTSLHFVDLFIYLFIYLFMGEKIKILEIFILGTSFRLFVCLFVRPSVFFFFFESPRGEERRGEEIPRYSPVPSGEVR